MSCDGNRGRFVRSVAVEPEVAAALGGGNVGRAQQVLETLFALGRTTGRLPATTAQALTRVVFAQMRGLGLPPPTHSASGLPRRDAQQGYALLAQTLAAIRTHAPLPPLAAEVVRAAAPAAPPPVSPPPPLTLTAAPPDASGLDADQRAWVRRLLPPWLTAPALVQCANDETGASAGGYVLDTLAATLVAAGLPSHAPLWVCATQPRGPGWHAALAAALLTATGHPRCGRCGRWVHWDLPHTCPVGTPDALTRCTVTLDGRVREHGVVVARVPPFRAPETQVRGPLPTVPDCPDADTLRTDPTITGTQRSGLTWYLRLPQSFPICLDVANDDMLPTPLGEHTLTPIAHHLQALPPSHPLRRWSDALLHTPTPAVVRGFAAVVVACLGAMRCPHCQRWLHEATHPPHTCQIATPPPLTWGIARSSTDPGVVLVVPPADAPRVPPPAVPLGALPSPTSPPGALSPAVQCVLAHSLCVAFPQERAIALANQEGPPCRTQERAAITRIAEALVAYGTASGMPAHAPLLAWAAQITPGAGDARVRGFLRAYLTARGQVRCGQCGQFCASVAGVVHTCPGTTTRWRVRDGRLVPWYPTVTDATEGAAQAGIGLDPIANPALAELWGHIASTIAGHACTVVLRPGGGFATDMHGTIFAEPYPLGADAPAAHNLLVTKAGIYHEIGHELVTPPADWATVLAIAAGEETVAGITVGAGMLPLLYNLVEDGRMERALCDRFAGVAETLAAACHVAPRWDERVGAGVSRADEVVWALLYTALPFFAVRDAVRAAMTPEGRALFETLEPIVQAGVMGDADASLAAAITLTRHLEAAGIVTLPAVGTPPASPAPGTPTRGAQGKRLPDSVPSGSGEAHAPADAEHTPDDPSDGFDDAASGTPARGETGKAAAPPALTTERLDTILTDIETQASTALQRHVRRHTTTEALGRRLHAPLTAHTPVEDTQCYRDATGALHTIVTHLRRSDAPHLSRTLADRAPAQRAIAGRLARQLDAIRQETITRQRMQTEGALDRRRLVAGMTGQPTIRTRAQATASTGMTVSVLLDQSGSMRQHIDSGQVYDAACILGQTFEALAMPYEVRGHGGASTQYKTIGDATFDPARAAALTVDHTGSNAVTGPVIGLATTALLASEQPNKLIVNLMDGAMDDHADTVAQYAAARRQGVLAFGVFLGDPSPPQQTKLTEIFGAQQWRAIGSLTEMPTVVGQRIARLFDEAGDET